MANEDPEHNDPTADDTSFPDHINPLLAGLFYPSESDEPIEPVTCSLRQDEPLTNSQLNDWLRLPPTVHVADVPEAHFWEPVVTDQDWYGDEERAVAARFRQLRQTLENELTGRQVFHVGETEIDVYLLGCRVDGTRAGIRTKIVQT